MGPDPKPEGRIKDAALLGQLHREWRECALCLVTDHFLSLHHINKHPRDDVRGNLIMLCGSGTTGCHGRIEVHDRVTSRLLAEVIEEERPDVIEYLEWRLGHDQAREKLALLSYGKKW